MENVLFAIFSVQTVIFCLAIYLSVLLVRRVVETGAKQIARIFPDKWEPWWIHTWREWILPIMPIMLGGLVAALARDYPYPEALGGSNVARIFYGLVAGWASAYVYRSAKALIGKVLPQKMADEIESKMDVVVGSGELPDPTKIEE